MVARLCEYIKKTIEFNTINACIMWDINYISVKFFKNQGAIILSSIEKERRAKNLALRSSHTYR